MLDIPPIKLCCKVFFEALYIFLNTGSIRILVWRIHNIFVTEIGKTAKVPISFSQPEGKCFVTISTYWVFQDVDSQGIFDTYEGFPKLAVAGEQTAVSAIRVPHLLER